MLSDEIKIKLKIAALENAMKFKGKANQGAVMGKLFSIKPDAKQNIKEIAPEITKLISDINMLSPQEQKNLLLQLDPNYFDKEQKKKQQRKDQRNELPPLKNAEDGKVITRMPPGPSKYAHIGHAISFGINYLYSQMYNGKCILRFDDTNPEVEKKEFADSIKEDVLDYLDFKPEKTVYASDYMDKFVEMAEKLIEKKYAYVCNCPSERISLNRREMKECIHRTQTVEQNKELWEKMKSGKEKDNILRLKIDMKHKNAVMRDPAIYRVINTPHYRQENKYNVWPLYDFESAIMDGILGVTHVMRSNEFDSRIELHHYICELFDFEKLPYKHYGRISITGSLTKGREIRQKIDSGEYIGWDDPRLVTLRALKRRGILKETIINLIKKAGLSKSNTNIDFSVIAAENRKILDSSAKRFFFISEAEAKKITICGAPEIDNELEIHPQKDLGKRKTRTHEEFIIQNKDYEILKKSKEIFRLMDCINIKNKNSKISFVSKSHDDFKESSGKIIHWLSCKEDNIKTEILMPDATVLKGQSEPTIKQLKKGEVIQFERFGFCRLDSIDKQNNTYKFWYAHD